MEIHYYQPASLPAIATDGI